MNAAYMIQGVRLDAATHTIYTVTADFGPPQANGRPSVLPGTFVLMEIGR